MQDIFFTRLDCFEQLIQGYLKTGIPLIAWDGEKLYPFSVPDDLGIYYFMPKMVSWLHISPEIIYNHLYSIVIVAATFVGLLGFSLYYSSWTSRIIALIMLVGFARFSITEVHDVHQIYSATLIATIPLFLYFIQKNPYSPFFHIFMFFCGTVLCTSNFFRSHAATTALICMAILLVKATLPTQKKFFLVICLCVGWFIPSAYFAHLWNKHKAYVSLHFPNHNLKKSYHPFWHSIYCGFTILHPKSYFCYAKQDLPFFADNQVFEKLEEHSLKYSTFIVEGSSDQRKRINYATYPTQKIESILRNEVLHICRTQRLVVFYTLAAKIGIMLMLFLLFAHVGILAAFFYPKGWILEGAFFVSLAFSCLFGLLTMPMLPYISSFIACTMLYSLISINHALGKMGKSD